MPSLRTSCCLAAVLMACAAAVAAEPEQAAPGQSAPTTQQSARPNKDAVSLLPNDTLLFVQIDDISASQEALKRTSLYGLYKDPSMQDFVVPAEKAIRKKIDEAIEELWTDIKLENPPEKLPMPTGRAMLAVQMGMKTVQMPEYDWENYNWQKDQGGPPVKGMKEITVPQPRMLLIVQMGENMPQLTEIIAQAEEAAARKGYKHDRESVRDIEVHVLTPPPAKRPDGMPEGVPFQPSEPEPVCYCIADDTVYLSSNADMLKDTLARLAGAQSESLADDEGCKAVLRKLDAPGDLCFYLNVRALLAMVSATADADQRADAKIAALGFDNVTGLGLVAQLAPNSRQEFCIKGMLAVNGEERGIPALLSPRSASTAGNRLLTKGLTSFLVANYDFGTFYEKIRRIVLAMDGPDIDESLRQTMAATGGQEGQPPVDLQKDLLGQLAAPLIIRVRANKPYTDPDSAKIVFSIGVQDPGVVQTALRRIHETFIARGDPDMRRELLNTDIFLMPNARSMLAMFIMPAMPMMPSDVDEKHMMAVAVPGSNIVMGSLPTVEQEIRDLRREDSESIQADPMYRLAAAALPAEAGVWGYANDRARTEATWTQLKEQAKKASELPAKCPACGADLQGRATCPECGADVSGSDHAESSMNPLQTLVDQTKKFCDFSTLPDFQAVQKYFGATVGYAKSTEDGIYFETVTVVPPKEE